VSLIGDSPHRRRLFHDGRGGVRLLTPGCFSKPFRSLMGIGSRHDPLHNGQNRVRLREIRRSDRFSIWPVPVLARDVLIVSSSAGRSDW
jgi:hypothetical protein